jgi:hypothetical protein
MKKSSAAGATSSEVPHLLSVPMMAPVQLDTMLAVSHRVFEQMGRINRLWLDAVQEANSSGTDLSARLVKCSNPAEGAALCNEWVRERAAQFASDSQEAARLWMGLYGSAFAEPREAAGPHGEAEERGVRREKHPSSKVA